MSRDMVTFPPRTPQPTIVFTPSLPSPYMAFPPLPPAGACHTGTPPESVRTFPFPPEEFASEPRTPAAVFVTMPAELRGVTVSEPLETVRPFEAVSRLLTPSVPAIVVLPVGAVTTNLEAPTVRSPVTPRVWAIVAAPWMAVVRPDWLRFTLAAVLAPIWITEVLPVPLSIAKTPASGPVILPAWLTENFEKPLTCRSIRLPL